MKTKSVIQFRFMIFLVLFSESLFSFYKVSGQDRFGLLTHALESKQKVLGGNVCMLVFKDNGLIYEKNLGSYTSSTPEMIASCSKWLTAGLIATFIDEGLIAPEDSIGRYLPIFSQYKKGGITISQCMSHTSGIESEPITFRLLLERRKMKSLADEVNTFAEKPVIGKQGTVFCYGNIGLNIVGRILEVISHKDFETLFQERIARPLGMNHTSFASKNAINPSGGAISTAGDYMNFLRMLLGNGLFNGQRILRAETVRLMQVSRTSAAKVVYTPAEAKGYEYGWGEWILEKGTSGNSTVISSPGLFGTYPWVDLQRNYAAIVFVKNLRINDRQNNYTELREAVDASVK